MGSFFGFKIMKISSVRHFVKEYFTMRLFEKDFQPRERNSVNNVYDNYLIQEPVYV